MIYEICTFVDLGAGSIGAGFCSGAFSIDQGASPRFVKKISSIFQTMLLSGLLGFQNFC